MPQRKATARYTGAVTPAKVQAESSNGIKVDTTYTPEIVPVTPTATPVETTDIQGATQTGKPEFKGGTVTVDGVEKTVAINEDVPATFDDGSTTKTVKGVGTYTVAPDGTVTFVPEKSFVGTAPAVTVVREDKNGTKASATYTPTVTPVTPTATPAVSTDVQGATQTGKPEFKGGTVEVNGVEKTIPINEDVLPFPAERQLFRVYIFSPHWKAQFRQKPILPDKFPVWIFRYLRY